MNGRIFRNAWKLLKVPNSKTNFWLRSTQHHREEQVAKIERRKSNRLAWWKFRIPSLAGCKRKLKGRNRSDNRRWRSVEGAGKLEIARQPRNRERNRPVRKTLREKSVFTFRPESQCRILLLRNEGTKRLGPPVASLPTRHANARRPFSLSLSLYLPIAFLFFLPFHNDFSNELQSLAIPEYPHRRLEGGFGSSAFFLRAETTDKERNSRR